LKRFLTPLLVLSLGIFVSLVRDTSGQPWQPLLARPTCFRVSSWRGRA